MAKERKYRKRDSSSESSDGATNSDSESEDELKKKGKKDKEGDKKEDKKDKHKKHKKSHKSEDRDRDRDRSRDKPHQRSRSRDRDRRERSGSRDRRRPSDRGSPRRRGDYDRDRDRDRRGPRDDYGGRRPRSRSPPGDRYRRRSRSQDRGDRDWDREREGRREEVKPAAKPGPGRNAKLLDYINAEKAEKEGAAAAVAPLPAVKSGFLGGMLMSHDRINERMDKRERAAAEERLRQLNTSKAKREIRDGYARGVNADVVKPVDLPYKCTECRSSFPTAPSLSDHLKVAHNIRKHPSQIYQTAAKPMIGGGAADD